MERFLKHFPVFLLVIAVAGLSGCTSGGLPTAPDLVPEETTNVAITPSLEGQGDPVPMGPTIAITPRPLTKRALGWKRHVREKTIGPRGGKLAVANRGTATTFSVPKNALEEKTRIRMALQGSGASVQVHFGPSGLQFQKDCVLKVAFPKGDIDPKSLGGYLIEKGGAATPVPYSVEVKGRFIIVRIFISHFSIYSPDDGSE